MGVPPRRQSNSSRAAKIPQRCDLNHTFDWQPRFRLMMVETDSPQSHEGHEEEWNADERW